ncbi:LIMLP_03685 family anti-sigma factor [Leptospira barantonii]|nr:FecR family protein [Leptospira barantonii]
MRNNSNFTRRAKMQKAISNEMTRNELGDFLSDPLSKKEFFELMKLKNQIGRLNVQTHPFTDVSIRAQERIFDFKNFFLAAASVLILSTLAIYFMFFRFHRNELSIVRSITTGQCSIDQNPNGKEILFKAEEDSFCDYRMEGDLGLTLRLLPNSEFYVVQNGNEADLNLNYGIVLFTTHKNRSFLKIRSKAKTLSSELLGTTLVLIANSSLKQYKILVLDGAIRVKEFGVQGMEPEVRVGYEIVKDYVDVGNQNESDSNTPMIGISKIESNTFKKYRILSKHSESILNEESNKNEHHDEKTISILRKETGISERTPTYKIVLKNGKNFRGYVEETDRFYILTDAEGKKTEIDKKDIEELELIPSEN